MTGYDRSKQLIVTV